MSVAAYHEAGHALAYVHISRQLTSVSIDGDNGLTAVVPNRIDLVNLAVVSAMGPVAEAIYTLSIDDDRIPWDTGAIHEHVAGAIYTGGHNDYEDGRIVFRDFEWVESLRDVLTAHWGVIDRLALALLERGSVPGAEAERLLRAELYRRVERYR